MLSEVDWAGIHPGNDHRRVDSAAPPDSERVVERSKKSALSSPLVIFLVMAAPAVWLGILVFLYGVDTPWGDQWDGTWPLLEKLQMGTLRFADFFAFHNEHRILFPRLIAVGLARLTDWNIRAELLVIWLLACLCSLNLWRVTRVTGLRNFPNVNWLFLAANVMLFTPLQCENFLWGFQIGFLLPLACLTACLWVAPSLSRPFDFLATMILCLVCTFSIASGFISWFLTAPLLLLRKEKPAKGDKLWWLGWLLVGTTSLCLYFRGYTQPAAHPSVWEAWRHPFRAVQFVLAYLGTPFLGTAPEPSLFAPMASTALLILLAGCLVYLWKSRDGALLAQSLPWVLLACSAVINALLTMLGRMGFGSLAATQSRYVSFAIMLPIGLLFLTALVFQHWRQRFPVGGGILNRGRTSVAVLIATLATALSLLFVCGTIKSLEFWKRFQHNCLSGKAALLLVNVIDEPEILAHHVHWAGPQLKGWANKLDRMGYLRPALVRSNRIREIASQTIGETMGELTEFYEDSGAEDAASGWAILPESHRVADGVLLTYDDAQGEPIIFALAEVVSNRADVSDRLHDTTYLRSGWRKTWKATQVPAGSQWIRAWAFDAESGRAYHIGAGLPKSATAAP